MKKRIFVAIIGVLLLVGILAGIKTLQIRRMTEQKSAFIMPPEIVTTAEVHTESWETTLTAVGSLVAVQGVDVAAETAGKITRIAFEPGSSVKKGDLLVQLDTTAEEAQLRAAETAAALAKNNLDRSSSLRARGTISQSAFDNAKTLHEQAAAQIDNLRAIIGKKIVRAPFTGRLGIRQVNLGQFLKEGTPIVTLQALDPIFVNFPLPQQNMATIRPGLPVRLTSDALPDQSLEGRITTISPEVDNTTRSIRIQATVANRDEQLRPGMFVEVAVILPAPRSVQTIPATSVLYAPYSDSVFVVEDKQDEKSGQSGKVLRQQFVRLGDRRGDFVEITSGLKAGDTIVSTGVFKLRNGQAVVIDNTLNPEFLHAPEPKEG
jgi:membrane fusion protein (multidrug efflux system)